MYLSEDYFVFHIHQKGEERLLHELEHRRVMVERIAERDAELAATQAAEGTDPGHGMTDAGRPRRGIRALLPRRRAQAPSRPAHDAGTLPSPA